MLHETENEGQGVWVSHHPAVIGMHGGKVGLNLGGETGLWDGDCAIPAPLVQVQGCGEP